VKSGDKNLITHDAALLDLEGTSVEMYLRTTNDGKSDQ